MKQQGFKASLSRTCSSFSLRLASQLANYSHHKTMKKDLLTVASSEGIRL